MTDEDNKRQRHLAEMMIAQCEGKTVQVCVAGKWVNSTGSIIENIETLVRIKPEPREWWLCTECNQRFVCKTINHSQQRSIAKCNGEPFLIREVLNE